MLLWLGYLDMVEDVGERDPTLRKQRLNGLTTWLRLYGYDSGLDDDDGDTFELWYPQCTALVAVPPLKIHQYRHAATGQSNGS